MTENLDRIWREYRPGWIKPGDVVVDLGCSDGYFTRWAQELGAVVDAYDARAGTAARVDGWTITPGGPGVAVGPYDGWCRVKGEGFGAYIVPGEGDTPMLSLSTILGRRTHVDFLKCDIEGGEYLIFDGVDLSNVARIGMEFHAWTTPDRPIPGLGFHAEPMPDGAFDRLVAHLERTHRVEVVGPPEAGGYLYAARREGPL